ncbi:uncharacterized protein LOC105284836 isoform X2 [Ooceraea biroi]|uniref:TGF-beta propeptide domain-containing protein n=1 Tax=Ooceraea biroi TaxID=2015173 RepID=A0A026WZN1_OOCBI|nr:uncharacterized protein LOC105284836 isoform X2 [Ooceraea biroi]EZA61520.1 hypothetical protein X777_07853 [Ooceraea biroi]
MAFAKSFVLLLLVSIAANAWTHHHHHHNRHGFHPEHRKGNEHLDSVERKSSFESEKTADPARSESPEDKKPSEVLNSKESIPFSSRRLEKMLEKAILKIIMGDLGTAEMLLLKSLNYTPEEVLAIRERELDKRKDEELRMAELKSGERKFYGGDLYGSKAKHWNYNSMEFDSSSRNEPDIDMSRNERKRNRYKERNSYDKDFDFDAYNRQAVIDYENLASKLELQQSRSEPANTDYEDESRNSEERDSSQNFHRSFDRAMEPHVIFKISYDDSEFDSNSGSEERSKFTSRDSLVSSKGLKHHIPSTLRHTTAKNVANSFHAPSLSTVSSSSSASAEQTSLPVVYQLGNFKGVRSDYSRNQPSLSTTESPEPVATSTIITNVTFNATLNMITDSGNSTNDDNLPVKDVDVATNRNISEYEGLEWVEDDVYRVIPSFVDSLAYDNPDDNETSDYGEQSLNFLPEGGENDTLEYQNDAPDPVKLFMANVNASIDNTSSTNLSTYQQLALAHRRDQGQKAIEDIKTRVLALTGRFNLSTNTNQVQRERLTMFSPTCQIPRNTDSETWMDPFSMNMHFQLNLTSGDHVIAAKLRIYKLPQENLTASASGGFDEDEDDEKKIRISIYYYTKSLKKHRSKKRLMDSIVTPLTIEGTHLALDVRQGLRFWRLASRNPHGNGSNHGLVIQIEDQDGRPLKPALYIQQPSCGDHNSDQKASQRTPALFVRACPRYVRVVNGEKIMYVNCRH